MVWKVEIIDDKGEYFSTFVTKFIKLLDQFLLYQNLLKEVKKKVGTWPARWRI